MVTGLIALIWAVISLFCSVMALYLDETSREGIKVIERVEE